MKRNIRIQRLEEQDTLRRSDMARMSPTERLDLLVRWRDRTFPDSPLKRVATIRSLKPPIQKDA